MNTYSKKPIAVLGLLALLVSQPACDQGATGSTEAAPPTRQVIDDLGRQVEVPDRPKRIATMSLSAVEYLIALDHPPVLRPDVAEDGIHPDSARQIPAMAIDHSVGPNLEQLAAAEVDLVISNRTFSMFAEAIEKNLGIPVVAYEIDSLEDVPAKAKTIGELIGKPEAGESLARKLEQQIEAVQPPSGTAGPRVFAMLGTPAAHFAFRGESYLGDMIEHLDGELITREADPTSDGLSNQFAPFSLEVVVERDPQVILMARHGPPGEHSRELKQRSAWGDLSAVQSGRVHLISQRLYVTNPGPRAPEALRQLRHLLYPQADHLGWAD